MTLFLSVKIDLHQNYLYILGSYLTKNRDRVIYKGNSVNVV